MDPNEVLRDLREVVAEYNAARERKQQALARVEESGEDAEYSRIDSDWFDALENASVALDWFEALDEWLSKGGFLPAGWAKVRHASTSARS